PERNSFRLFLWVCVYVKQKTNFVSFQKELSMNMQPHISKEKISLSEHFETFRKNIVGINQEIETPFGNKKLIYADWIASGRLYEPIENTLLKTVGPWVANTHTETSFTGAIMTHAYENARQIIKKSVNANKEDVLI